MLGLLALLLAFTFSAALQRYDDRSQTVVAEANAIGAMPVDTVQPNSPPDAQEAFHR